MLGESAYRGSLRIVPGFVVFCNLPLKFGCSLVVTRIPSRYAVMICVQLLHPLLPSAFFESCDMASSRPQKLRDKIPIRLWNPTCTVQLPDLKESCGLRKLSPMCGSLADTRISTPLFFIIAELFSNFVQSCFSLPTFSQVFWFWFSSVAVGKIS